MRTLWEKLLRFLFRPFVSVPCEPCKSCDHEKAVGALAIVGQENVALMQAFMRAQMDRQSQIIFAAQGALQQDLAKLVEEICKIHQLIDCRRIEQTFSEMEKQTQIIVAAQKDFQENLSMRRPPVCARLFQLGQIP